MQKSNQTQKKIKAALDSARALFRGDDGYYCENLVNQTLAEIYKAEFPSLNWANGSLLGFKEGVSPGAFSYDYVSSTSVGRAKFVPPNATDISRADTSIDRTQRSIHTLAHSFSFTTQDLRAAADAAKLGMPYDLPSLLAESCRQGHDEELNDAIAFGVESLGLYGVTNHPGITVSTATTGDWLNPATTADQIYEDVVAAWTQQKQLTRGVERPDTFVVSSAIMGRLMTTFINNANGSNITLLMAMEMNMGVKVKEEETMALASASGSEALLMMNSAPTKAFVVMPLYLAPLEPEKQNLNIKTVMESRYGGVSAPKPLSILRLDGI